MKVEVKELKMLLSYIENKISKLESSEEKSASELFNLNIVDSNLSLLLSGLTDEKEYNLTDRHPHIKKALCEFRKKDSLKNDETEVLENIASSCKNLLSFIKKIKKAASDSKNDFLEKNIISRLDFAQALINEIALINELPQKEAKKWLSKNIDIDTKIGAKILGSKTSPLKAQAARQNGKKGGRPPLKKKRLS